MIILDDEVAKKFYDACEDIESKTNNNNEENLE